MIACTRGKFWLKRPAPKLPLSQPPKPKRVTPDSSLPPKPYRVVSATSKLPFPQNLNGNGSSSSLVPPPKHPYTPIRKPVMVPLSQPKNPKSSPQATPKPPCPTTPKLPSPILLVAAPKPKGVPMSPPSTLKASPYCPPHEAIHVYKWSQFLCVSDVGAHCLPIAFLQHQCEWVTSLRMGSMSCCHFSCLTSAERISLSFLRCINWTKKQPS